MRREVCVLSGEIIIYQAPTPQSDGKITAYNKYFTFSKQVIDQATYGIGKNVQHFECLPELNVFITLSTTSAFNGLGQPSDKQITVYRGGAMLDSLRRILFSIGKVDQTVVALRSFAQFDRVVIVPLDMNGAITSGLLNIDTLSPNLATIADGVDINNVGKSIDFKLTGLNLGQDKGGLINGSFKILEPLKTETPVLRGEQKAIMKNTNFDVNLALKLQSTHIEDCVTYFGDKEVEINQNLYLSGTEESPHEKLKNLETKIGNFERFATGGKNFFDIVSYYRYSETSTLEFGKLELYTSNEDGSLDKSSALQLPSALRSVSTIVQDQISFSAILTNEGIVSSLKLAVSNGNVFSKIFLDIKT